MEEEGLTDAEYRVYAAQIGDILPEEDMVPLLARKGVQASGLANGYILSVEASKNMMPQPSYLFAVPPLVFERVPQGWKRLH